MDNYVITIARGFGSGGKEIGTKLGEKLGIPCYENQILDMASEQSGIGTVSYTHLDIFQNPAMLDALIGVYERNVLGYPSTAVLPYSQGLSRFPAHLQQLDMESNGKSVNRFGEPVDLSLIHI